MAYGYSAVLPLQKSPEDGFYALTKTIAQNTKQNLKNLLLTNPGERVMIPDFGVGLRYLLFENTENVLISKVTERIEDQVSTYLPYVLINGIDYLKLDPPHEGGEDRNALGIQIYYSVPQFGFSDLLEVHKIAVE